MPVPQAPILKTYNGTTHVITGIAEAGSSVAIFDNAVQFGPTVTAAGDGSFSIVIGDLIEGTDYSFVAIATNIDGGGAPSAAIDVSDRSGGRGEWISGDGNDYDFTGTDLNDNLGFRTDGDLTLRGGGGNDFYYVDSFSDIVIEQPGGGYDRVDIQEDSEITEYTLPANTEWLSGRTDIDIILNGNELNNDVVGQGTLNGGLGNDTVRGVYSDFAFERGSLLLGGEGDDTLSGDDANDTIDGGPGIDTAIFGQFSTGVRAGDIYITAQDDGFLFFDARTVSEFGHQGMDFVRNVEFFQFLDQTIAAEDLLDRSTLPPPPPLTNFFNADIGQIGGTALPGSTVVAERTTNFGGTTEVLGENVADAQGNWLIDFDPAFLSGGAFDTYAKNANGRSSESTDYLYSSNLFDSDALIDDTLIGSERDESLSGGFGKSTLIGGGGDDSYSFGAEDVIVELPDGGTDTVFVAFDGYTLGENLENLKMRGGDGLTGNGNDGDNVISGNDRTSRGTLFEVDENLNGMGGNDTLIGLRGNDSLDGGAGEDIAVFSGNRSDYLASVEGEGFRLIDQRPPEGTGRFRANPNEGSDFVTGVEIFRFADGDILDENLLIGSGPTTGDVQANSFTAGDQFNPDIVALADGGHLIVWNSRDEDGDGLGVFGQIYNADGSRRGEQFQVNQTTTGNQDEPDALALPDGSFIVTWRSDQSGFERDMARSFDQAGTPAADEFVLFDDHGSQRSSEALGDGNFLVVRETCLLGIDEIAVGVFAPDGSVVVAEFTLNTTGTVLSPPDLAKFADGSFLVTWTQDLGAGDVRIMARRLDSAGAPDGGQFELQSGQVDPAVPVQAAELAGGGYVAVWQTAMANGEIMYRLFDDNDVPQGPAATANSVTSGDQTSANVTALTNGGFVVAWNSANEIGGVYDDEDGLGIYAQIFGAQGDKVGDEFLVNAMAAGDQSVWNFGPSIAQTAIGEFTVVWSGDSDADLQGVFLRRFAFDDPIGPDAVDDTVSVDEDAGSVTISVLTNDSDPEGDAFSVTGNTAPANGTVTDNGDGTFDYTPDADFNGSDSFTYTISDVTGSGTATVSITVNPVNDAPVAVNDTASVDEDSSATINVLANDRDVDGDPLIVTAGPAFSGGVFVSAGDINYVPDPDFNGTDSFTYTISDGNGGTNTATVSVTVNPVNDDPVAADDAVIATIDQPSDYAAATLLANDSDIDGDVLVITAVGGGVNGSASLNGSTVTFAPDPGFTGPASFTYSVNDGNGGTDTATVDVTVNPSNLPPDADATRSVTTLTNTALVFDIIASDPDGDALSFSAGTPANGAVSVAGGRVTYTPGAGFTGADTFTVTIDDGNGATATQEVTVTTQNQPLPNQFVMFAADGFTGGAGGSGKINGTDGFQQIAVIDVPGAVALDPSFNRGGDILQLLGDASAWNITRSGSSALFSDGDTFVTVPIGNIGLAVQFDDGVRELVFDSGNFTIGGQAFATGTLSPITAAPDGTPLPTGADPAAKAVLFIAADAGIAAAGVVDIFGAAGNELASLISGNLALDASFNRGGDTIAFDEAATDYSASQSGSSVRLTGTDTTALIPVGTSGATLAFGDGSDTRTVLFDTGVPGITIDGQLIGTDPVQLMAG